MYRIKKSTFKCTRTSAHFALFKLWFGLSLYSDINNSPGSIPHYPPPPKFLSSFNAKSKAVTENIVTSSWWYSCVFWPFYTYNTTVTAYQQYWLINKDTWSDTNSHLPLFFKSIINLTCTKKYFLSSKDSGTPSPYFWSFWCVFWRLISICFSKVGSDLCNNNKIN